MLNMFN